MHQEWNCLISSFYALNARELQNNFFCTSIAEQENARSKVKSYVQNQQSRNFKMAIHFKSTQRNGTKQTTDKRDKSSKINKLSRSVLWQQQDLRDKAMKHDTVMQEQRQLTQEQKTKKNRHKTDQIITLSYFRNNRQTELKPAIFPTPEYGCMLIVIVVNLC